MFTRPRFLPVPAHRVRQRRLARAPRNRAPGDRDAVWLWLLLLLAMCAAADSVPKSASAPTAAAIAIFAGPTSATSASGPSVSGHSVSAPAASGRSPSPRPATAARAEAGTAAAAPAAATSAAASGRGSSIRTDVFVLGTLYKRHQSVPAYDLPTLRRIVLAIKPEVLVLDCTPREVEEQTVSPGKIEYPGVIFPLIRAGTYRVYAAEPREPMFSEIVRAVSAVHASFKTARPESAAALDQLQTGTYAALAQHWQSPAEVNDDVTGAALSGKKALEGALVGPAEADGWTRWNRHWTDTILEAVAQHPGARTLAVTGIENRPWIVAALRTEPRVNVIDLPAWLRSHSPDIARVPEPSQTPEQQEKQAKMQEKKREQNKQK